MDVLAADDRSTCFTAVKDIGNGGMQRKESTEKDRNETELQESSGVWRGQRQTSSRLTIVVVTWGENGQRQD